MEKTKIIKLNMLGLPVIYLNSVDKERLKNAKKYITELTKKHPKTLVAKLNK